MDVRGTVQHLSYKPELHKAVYRTHQQKHISPNTGGYSGSTDACAALQAEGYSCTAPV